MAGLQAKAKDGAAQKGVRLEEDKMKRFIILAAILLAALVAAPACDDSPVDGDTDADVDVGEDTDHDGVPDDIDNCPDVPNSDQTDADGDQLGNKCDDDLDGDGYDNDTDNCPEISNPAQTDSDGDGVGDLCQGNTPGCIPGPLRIRIEDDGGENMAIVFMFNPRYIGDAICAGVCGFAGVRDALIVTDTDSDGWLDFEYRVRPEDLEEDTRFMLAYKAAEDCRALSCDTGDWTMGYGDPVTDGTMCEVDLSFVCCSASDLNYCLLIAAVVDGQIVGGNM